MSIYFSIYLVFFFFFFKQKTAYEMRISDWSSDVCSSDLSAAAIMASALIELSTVTAGEEGAKYLGSAERVLESLSATPYKAEAGTNGGFILQYSVGSIPHDSEIDVPLTYADYYYIEALMRYKRLLDGHR